MKNSLAFFTPEHIALIIGGCFAVAEVVVRLTPTEKDNSIYNKVKTIVDAILPNLKKDGGVHK